MDEKAPETSAVRRTRSSSGREHRGWALFVLMLGMFAWLGLFAAVYDPDAWLIPIGAPEAAFIATIVVAPVALVVWTLGLVVVWVREGRRRSASA